MSTTDVDVIVVGGGPVGVTTALLLAQRGFSVRVLERAPEVYDLPRAIVMDDEIQRVFQDAGLGDELDAITTPLLGAEFVRPDGERIIGVELPLDAPLAARAASRRSPTTNPNWRHSCAPPRCATGSTSCSVSR